MLTRAFPPLVLLLGLVELNDAQYGKCDYERYFELGESGYIFSPKYPQNEDYDPGTYCRWTARSDHPIQIKCNPFLLPQSDGCSVDVVIIQTSNRTALRYCGTREINLVSEGNQLIVALQSSSDSPGGRFYCTLEVIKEDDSGECHCGWKDSTKIVGGTETGINEYPMMAGVVDSVNKILYCGATIINNRQVVTAAHCLIGENSTATLGVVVGEHDLLTGKETNATKLFRVAKFVIHPRYSVKTQDYDIAIITISGVIKFNRQVGPACLPFQHSPDTFAGSFVDILGWGTTDFAGPRVRALHRAELSVITNKNCKQKYPQIGTKQMCTLTQGKDSCQFDSGGPLLWRNPTTKRLVLVGIIGYGSICADGTPAVNSRIGAYMDWIISQSPRDFHYCDVE